MGSSHQKVRVHLPEDEEVCLEVPATLVPNRGDLLSLPGREEPVKVVARAVRWGSCFLTNQHALRDGLIEIWTEAVE